MKNWTVITPVVAAFMLSACGGGGTASEGGASSGGGQSVGAPLTLSGMVLWDAPIANAQIEVRCNTNPQVQTTRSGQDGRYSITIFPTQAIPLSGAAAECVARASWPVNGFVHKTESYAVNYEQKDALRMNFNAAAGIWTQAMSRPYFDVKRSMDRNQWKTLPLNEFTFNQGATGIFAGKPFLANIPSLLPEGFSQRPFALRPQSYAFEMGDAHAQAVMQLARDLDMSAISEKHIGLNGGGSAAAPHFPHFAPNTSFTRSGGGNVVIGLAAGSSFEDEVFTYEDGKNTQNATVSDFMPVTVALVTSQGLVHSIADVMVRKFGGTTLELGPQFNLDALPSGTVLRVYVYNQVFGFAELRL